MIKTHISTWLAVLLAVAQMAHAQQDAANDAGGQTLASAEVESAGQAPAAESGMLSLLFEKGLAKYKAGQYNEAIMVFDAMLAIDKYDSRAVAYRKRAAERVASKEAKKKGTSRAQAIANINAAWNPEPKALATVEVLEGSAVADPEQQAIQRMEARLKAITIPSLDFTDANIEDVLLFLSEASRRLGSTGEDVDIALVGMERASGGHTVSISMADMNLYDALKFVVEMTSLRFEIKPNFIAIMPANYVPVSQMVMRSYDIVPEIGADLESASDSAAGADDLFGDAPSGDSAVGPVDVAGFFSIVDFPVGSSAIYQPRFHKLFVKNTPKNLKVIEAVLADLGEEVVKHRSQQVEIETKFVEFSEGALEELGFDWNMFGSGTAASMGLDERGVITDAGNLDPRDPAYEIVPPSLVNVNHGNNYIDPITGQQIYNDGTDRPGQNVFGSAQRNNLGAFETIGSGLLGLMGGSPATMLFNNGDIDVQISAMEQEGTADVMSAPRVTTKSGTEAVIRVAETHRYPQDYDVETGQRTSPIVKPQDWEDFDMGVSLTVTPVVDSETSTIDLDLHPEIIKFTGFDEYLVGFNAYDAGGNTAAPGGDGSPLIAKMVSFERRLVQTQVTVADGHTVVMGGLISERTETFRDQVPFLGDIPYLGRLFRTEGSRTTKKNLTIFVKASQVDDRGMTRAERELAAAN